MSRLARRSIAACRQVSSTELAGRRSSLAPCYGLTVTGVDERTRFPADPEAPAQALGPYPARATLLSQISEKSPGTSNWLPNFSVT